MPRPSQRPHSTSGRLKFFDPFSLILLQFEHSELSLEDSRSTLYTRIVELVVMVASPHLSYMYIIYIFSSSDAC